MALSKTDLNDIENLLGRKPSDVETSIFDTMWSEHCSYKSSKPVLKQLPTTGSDVALGVGEDSGIVRFTVHDGKQYCIAVSHESHNHPSQILPVEGAATGVGGVVRDVYCMGADVIGVLNSLHFGQTDGPKKPLVEEIAERVVLGISDYGNPLGVPVLGGETLYHESYNDNCLVNVAAIGLIQEDDIIHSYVPQQAKDEPYDVILLGKSTDGTGYGGASFSSATLDKADESVNLGAVQVHDPFLKRVLVEAIKSILAVVKDKKIPIGFKDLGAGGIACAASELAVAGGFGVILNLEDVHVISENLLPEVVTCSETQERFCMVVPRSFTPEVLDIVNNQFDMSSIYPNAGASVIGHIISDLSFKILSHGKVLCDLPVKAITTDVKAHRESKPREIIRKEVADVTLNTAIENVCQQYLSSKNNASKRYIYRFFDNAVKGNTIVYPGESDAVVIAPIQGSMAGIAVSMDSNLYGNYDPYACGAIAVAESVRNVVSVGAQPIAITDCLNYGNPEKADVFFDFEQGVKGISDAARHLSFIESEAIPVISGNVSLYNESKEGSAVVPSPVVLCVGKMDDYSKVITNQLHESNLTLFCVGKRYAEFLGTQLDLFISSNQKGGVPQVRFEDEHTINKVMLQLNQRRLLSSCHDISMGGMWISVMEMVLGERGLSKVGLALDLDSQFSIETWLFSENGGFVIAVEGKNQRLVTDTFDEHGIFYSCIGKTVDTLNVDINYKKKLISSLSLANLASDWNVHN
ncbi:phosphoribosylformylglycinamidine synthase subunit PurL [Candidatus Marinamargulisbacteria bacterium SCGC AG-410-N11]|nr:phosphoribosylformylglycinamidine synthase subunit PurL [Candidatus Marinamargulisbacteria bacterium SCGC AG-410-N11]